MGCVVERFAISVQQPCHAIEQLLTMETTVRCAYVHHDPDSGIVRFKHLDGTTITDQASSR